MEQIIEFDSKPFPIIIIKNRFSEKELIQVTQELDFLTKDNKLKDFKVIAAYDEETDTSKRAAKHGAWLNTIYRNLTSSDIYRTTRSTLDLINEVETDEWFFTNMEASADSILISYYDEGDYYKAHKDYAFITAVTWLHREPKGFEGGELVFTDYGMTIPIMNNTTVLFPSCIEHEVREITNVDYEGGGRYAIIQFIHNIDEYA